VELVDIDGGVVKVRLMGACGGCPMAQMTLKGGIEAALKERIPAVERVESV
jgi:Fe-S cluster biogenesis protein NfuA